MKEPTPRRIRRYVCQCLRLKAYLNKPGDGRPRPQIPARHWLWSVLIGCVLRECSFHAVEALVCSTARRALDVGRKFGDDALAYFTERLDPKPTRHALASPLRLRSVFSTMALIVWRSGMPTTSIPGMRWNGKRFA